MNSVWHCVQRHTPVAIVTLGLFSSWLIEPAYPQNRNEPVQMWLMQGLTDAEYEQRLVTTAEQKLAELRRILAAASQPLTEAQETKLKLAVQGVASRSMQDLTQYKALTSKLDVNNQNDQQKAFEILGPAMQERQAGSFGKKSLFYRLVRSSLTAPQLQSLSAHQQESLNRRRRAASLRLVAELDERMNMIKSQRDKLVELMDKQKVKELPDNYDSIIGHVKLCRIPVSELKEFLDDKQVAYLRAIVEPYENVEDSLP